MGIKRTLFAEPNNTQPDLIYFVFQVPRQRKNNNIQVYIEPA